MLVILKVPKRLPMTVGVQVMPRLQKPPAPTPPLQVLLVNAKSPLAVMLPALSVNAAPPVLVKTTVCPALGLPTVCAAKLKLDGFSDTSATAVPVPFRVTVVVGLLSALLLMTRLPTRAPRAVGVKVRLILQLLAFANVVVQVLPLLMAKSPVATMLLMLSTAPPVLLRVTVLAVLVVPMPCAEKLSAVGLATLVLP